MGSTSRGFGGPEELRGDSLRIRRAAGRARRWLLAGGVAGILLVVATPGGGSGAALDDPAAGLKAPTSTGWVDVDYRALVDLRRVSHSGQPVGALLSRLEGRPFPAPGERPDDAALHRLLDPLLEPYAFVLIDAIDALAAAPDPPMLEVGGLWLPGEAQPAWAELLRARQYVVESDGAGRMRVFLPWAGGRPGEPEASPQTAAMEAWDAAWPVLRHVFASERLRLARRAGDSPERHLLDVEARAYVDLPETTRFRLGYEAYRVRVADTAAKPGRKTLDLAAWQAFLDRGLSVEGGRLDPQGAVRLLGSPTRRPPTLLGRPLTLSDFAVAYRAVFRGGAAESYMSLDRGDAPDVSNVNFGGRLRDTALGLVSLRSDIRFKTFSLGIDVAEGRDVRARIRQAVPDFRTHLERFAADRRTQGLMSQQTRLWFYPDAVDVTLSAQGDILVLRRARMSAASERLAEGAHAAGGEEPPWTRETVGSINASYDTLARTLPELADLDQAASLLTLFTWLRRAGSAGHPLPDLDALLDAPLPPVPTPRRFPQLLAYNVLPPAGASGEVEVLDRTEVGAALERLRPAAGGDLPPRRRLVRALAMLDPRQPDHLALAREISAIDSGSLDDEDLDFLAYRAERLFMHHLVLRTVGAGDRARLDAREAASGKPRVFSVGIGGIDLGMDQAIDRALAGDARLGSGAGAAARPPQAFSIEGLGETDEAAPAETAPSFEMPDHGLGDAGRRAPAREFARGWIRRGTWSAQAEGGSWVLTVLGPDGPEVRSRRSILGADGRASAFERVEDLRFLRYSMERRPGGLEAVIRAGEQGGTPPFAATDPASAEGDAPDSSSPGVSVLEVLGPPSAAAAPDPGAEPPSIRIRVRMPGRAVLEAAFPRAILQRLLLGPDLDLSAGKPLQGFTPPQQVVGGARSLMVAMPPETTAPPWVGPRPIVPGEEDPVRVAGAIARWWKAEPASAVVPSVVVATDARLSPGRWERAPKVPKRPLVLLPEDAFPGASAPLRDAVARACASAVSAPGLPAADVPDLVVLASGESPGLLGARLRALARDSRMKGKLLAVWPFAGPVRDDLPASLLAEGNLAAIGVAGFWPVGVPRAVDAIGRLAEAGRPASPERPRAEEIATELTWFY